MMEERIKICQCYLAIFIKRLKNKVAKLERFEWAISDILFDDETCTDINSVVLKYFNSNSFL